MNGHSNGVDFHANQAIEQERLDAEDIQNYYSDRIDRHSKLVRADFALEMAREAKDDGIAIGRAQMLCEIDQYADNGSDAEMIARAKMNFNSAECPF